MILEQMLLLIALLILLFIIDISRRLRLLERHLIISETREEQLRLRSDGERGKARHGEPVDG